MEKIDILLWAIGGGFTLIFALLCIMWNNMNHRFDKVDQRFNKIDETIQDIDRRLCRLEGAFSQKECCMLKEHHHHKAN